MNYCHFSHRNFTHVAGKIYKSHRTFLRSRHRRYLNVRVQIAVFYNSPCMCNIVTHISTAWPVLIVSSLSKDSCHYTFINLIHVFIFNASELGVNWYRMMLFVWKSWSNFPLFSPKSFVLEVEAIVELARSLTDFTRLIDFKITLFRFLTGETFLVLFNDMIKMLW